MATVIVHQRLAPGENTLWMLDEQDHKTIVEPLARIMARHSPIAGGAAGDVADTIEVAVGVTGYVLKNWQAAAELATSQQQAEQDRSAREGQTAA